jgi:hypothetical protein
MFCQNLRYGPLWRETSRFGCYPTQRAEIVLSYFCQCFIGYLPCGGNWVVRRGTIALFPGSANFGKTSQLFYYQTSGWQIWMLPYTEGRNCILLPFEKEIDNLGFAASVGNVFLRVTIWSITLSTIGYLYNVI